jgi:hypothetical protein
VVNATVQAARKAARSAFEKYHYDGTATVSEWGKVKDKESGLTTQGEVILLENQPCHLSKERGAAADQTVSAAQVSQTVKLFIAPDIQIKAGSKITVTQAGVTAMYTHSGKATVYDTHQEILLDLFEKFA